MLRFALYVGGFSFAAAAMVIYEQKRRATRPVPAKLAAALLQQAWADHHTTA